MSASRGEMTIVTDRYYVSPLTILKENRKITQQARVKLAALLAYSLRHLVLASNAELNQIRRMLRSPAAEKQRLDH